MRKYRLPGSNSRPNVSEGYVDTSELPGRPATLVFHFAAWRHLWETRVWFGFFTAWVWKWAGWRGTGRLNPSRETKFSGTHGDRGIFIFPVQLTTSRIGNLTRLIHTLLYLVCDDHTYIHTYKYHWSPLGRINASGIEWLGWQGRIAWLCAI